MTWKMLPNGMSAKAYLARQTVDGVVSFSNDDVLDIECPRNHGDLFFLSLSRGNFKNGKYRFCFALHLASPKREAVKILYFANPDSICKQWLVLKRCITFPATAKLGLFGLTILSLESGASKK